MSEAVVLQVLQPHDLFACVHYSCKLTARACVLRQQRRIVGMMGKPLNATTERLSSFCKTGQCEQGAAIREQLAGVDLEAPRPASVFLKPAVVEPIPASPNAQSGPSSSSGEGASGGEDGRHRGEERATRRTAVEAPPPKASTAASSPASTARSDARVLLGRRSQGRPAPRRGDRARRHSRARRGPRAEVT